MRDAKRILLAVVCSALLPAIAAAKSAIAGVVKDSTGAVLPGVTVEAASPALIERVRTVVTDGQGQYKIIDLRPGSYVVTFTLVGFDTVKREGIELTANFMAPVSAELRVGTVEETITVSGLSPVVDVQSVVHQKVMTAAVIEALPTGKTYENLGALIPGMQLTAVSRPSAQDVGGSGGESRHTMSIHGGRSTDFTIQLDGLPFNSMNGHSITGFAVNTAEAQEFSFELGALSAETQTGGVRMNVIPKEGGNLFKGSVFADFANHSLAADNSTDKLRARGLQAVNHLEKVWDINPAIGGPIRRDKLWFFGSYRYWGLTDEVAGMYFDKDPSDFVYTPDLNRRALDEAWNKAESLRLTWQATPINKIGLYFINEGRLLPYYQISGSRTPEAANVQNTPVDWRGQATWNAPLTSRLLLEAGFAYYRFRQNNPAVPEVVPGAYPVLEQSTNLLFRAGPSYTATNHTTWNYRTSMSYVTGSHAIKFGLTLQTGERWNLQYVNGDLNLVLLNGVPRSVTVNATPYAQTENMNADLGLFANEQWTVKRLTLNGGLRFDHHNASVPEQHLPAGRFVPARDFTAVSDVPNWYDLSPRMGVSYDLFGTGKTALKATLSRYVAGEVVEFARNNNPVTTSVNSATRTWNDLNQNFNPDCDFSNPAVNGECGAISNTSFGQVVIRTRYDDDVRQGFGKRGNNWEITGGVQHELVPGMSVETTYYRRWYANFLVTDNLAVTPADYNPFCVTAPVDSRLPGGGGDQVCGLYDLTPSKFGQVNNLVTFAKNYGNQWEHYNGIDVTANARLSRGLLVQGGLNMGRSETNNCFVVDSPQQLKFCDVKPPFQPQIKFLTNVPLPGGVQASATYQTLPGPQITASRTVTNAQISPSLGRNLAAGVNGTATIPLVSPGTMYDTRLYQLDGRLTKIFKVSRTRILAHVDIYNMLNASPVVLVNSTFGPNWQQPTYVLPGRMFKFGGQIEF